jgi:hypothetical protein
MRCPAIATRKAVNYVEMLTDDFQRHGVRYNHLSSKETSPLRYIYESEFVELYTPLYFFTAEITYEYVSDLTRSRARSRTP